MNGIYICLIAIVIFGLVLGGLKSIMGAPYGFLKGALRYLKKGFLGMLFFPGVLTFVTSWNILLSGVKESDISNIIKGLTEPNIMILSEELIEVSLIFGIISMVFFFLMDRADFRNFKVQSCKPSGIAVINENFFEVKSGESEE